MRGFFITQRNNQIYHHLTSVVAFLLTFSLVFSPVAGYAQAINLLNLPVPGVMIAPSSAFTPVLLKGMTIHSDNPLQFDFIIDSGNTNFNPDEIKKESERLVKYFLASMTVPKDDLWVNLSPYENDRIIPEELGKTELGRDMLAQDYILKQLTASLMYPEKELGKKFWDKVYTKAEEQFGTREIPVNTFNKVWILPERATVYEHEQTVYIVNAHLKVMLDSDYVAMEAQQADTATPRASARGQAKQNESLELQSSIIKEIIIPEIEREVNQGEHFAPLRQIYHSLILAKWYKETIKNSLLSQVYVDQNKISGIESDDETVKDQIYSQYIEAYKKGVFNYIKEDYDRLSNKVVPRKYFSGGLGLDSDVEIGRTSSPIEEPANLQYRASVELAPHEDSSRASSPIEKEEEIERLLSQRPELFQPAENEEPWDADMYKYGGLDENHLEGPYLKDDMEKKAKDYLQAVVDILEYLNDKQVERLDSILSNLMESAKDFTVYEGGAHRNEDWYSEISYEEIRVLIRKIREKLSLTLKGDKRSDMNQNQRFLNYHEEEYLKIELGQVLNGIGIKVSIFGKELQDFIDTAAHKIAMGEIVLTPERFEHFFGAERDIATIGLEVKGDYVYITNSYSFRHVQSTSAFDYSDKITKFQLHRTNKYISKYVRDLNSLRSNKDAGVKAASFFKFDMVDAPYPDGIVISPFAVDEIASGNEQVLNDVVEYLMMRFPLFGRIPQGELNDNFTVKGHVSDEAYVRGLFSVRSTPSVSIPGIFPTVLNLGSYVQGMGYCVSSGSTFVTMVRLRGIIDYAIQVLGLDQDIFKNADKKVFDIVNDIKSENEQRRQENPKLFIYEDPERLRNQALDRYVKFIEEKFNVKIPLDPKQQLADTVKAFSKTWKQIKQKSNVGGIDISEDATMGIIIQKMVFGNMNDNSVSGVAFSRNPNTAKRGLSGSYLIEEQGIELVSGVQSGDDIGNLKSKFPELYRALEEKVLELEKLARFPQEVEFTIQDGKLYFLQTRNIRFGSFLFRVKEIS